MKSLDVEKSIKKNKGLEELLISFKQKMRLLIESGDIENAKNLLEQYIELGKKDSDIYNMQGIIAIVEGDYNEAEKLLKKSLIEDNSNIDTYYNLGFLYEMLKKVNESELAYFLAKMYEKQGNRFQQKEDNEKEWNVVLFGEDTNNLDFYNKFRNEINILGILKLDENNLDENFSFFKIKDLKLLNYDYIILTDMKLEDYKMKLKKLLDFRIEEKNIFIAAKLDMQLPIEGFNYRTSEFIQKNKVEGIITGLSYAEVGIDTNYLKDEVINFALSSQDLYYDYKILEYFMRMEKVKNNIKYVILNLAYYSFDFDLSRTLERIRTHRYYPIIKDTHNYKDQLLIKLLNKIYNLRWTNEDYVKINNYKKNIVMGNDKDTIQKGKKYAIYHSKMNNEEVRKENLEIFEKILELLKQNNISPLILISPVSKNYYEHYDKKRIEEFYSNINVYIKRDNIKIVDLFDSELFGNSDFWDDSHLNSKGAIKLTKLIEKEL